MRRNIAAIVAWCLLGALTSVPSGVGRAQGNASPEKPEDRGASREETATFAMGCFWGPDALFGVLPGVLRTRVGYAGGTTENPTYHDLGGAAEVVEVDFDPSVIGYDGLLRVFWANHAPFGLAYNGQYRSILFVRDAEQRRQAEASWQEQASSGRSPTTEIVDLERFVRAEPYHQKFRLQNDRALFVEIRGQFASFDEFVDSTLAARVNGFLSGFGSQEQLERELPTFGLSTSVAAQLTSAALLAAAGGSTETCPVP